mmetsp:Transcript_19085/g.36478  ORF Transcript_19085/g.36478 Transcript_19085/m.36478 type:complete len:333 (+) Transcript_19085:95-1093(+)|eukprot:CAMPEP_0114247748 /NCGR_PEP_ID=MMETSP0058-20121206/13191_1 /TAXON_ID=36894 /ORGANISM="Pyramimonas parkeae, CCMP726" /LENGTH=332 /DNA_ID=CAMNT_0001361081 /DNA_START=174 /DNA_END=1172 /DNA_ORIENTATION=+
MAQCLTSSFTIAPVTKSVRPVRATAKAACCSTSKPVRAARLVYGAQRVVGRQAMRMSATRSVFKVQASASVEEGLGGLEKVVLKGSDGSIAEVYTFGGVVTSWVKDGRDVLYVRPDAVFDKSKPISGGIPHCWPQFGPGAMQVHGFARNSQWELTSTTDSDDPSCVMTLTPNEYTRGMWDHDFKVTQTITLKDGKLTAAMEVTNPGDKEFDFTGSFHTYFAASIEDVAVGGLSGLKTMDRLAGKESVQEGDVTASGPIDSVYYDAPNKLSLQVGGGRTVTIESTGWPDAVAWTPWTDMEACYKEFFCVENAACSPTVVAPGATWNGSMTLSV